MRNLLKVLQDRSGWTLGQLLADALWCFIAIWLAGKQVLGSASGANADSVISASAFALLMPLLYSFTGTYRRITLDAGLLSTVGRALLAVGLGTLIALLMLRSTSNLEQVLDFLGLAVLYMAIGVVAVRCIVRWAEDTSLGARRVLIVGTGLEARRVASDLGSDAHKHAVVVGFYPTTPQPVSTPTAGTPPVLPRSLSVEEVVDAFKVDEVIVAVEDCRGGVPMDQLLACRIRGTPVMDLAGFSERMNGEVPIESLRASWLVYEHGFAQGMLRKLVKRAFDIVSSFSLLIAATPVMALTALAIRLEDRSPVIYRQERVGLGGRTFTCLKFRSMRCDAENDGVARWASENDPRITRVGAFIRRMRIDELPQLFSVLRGEMSIVGPRPERPDFVRDLRQLIPYYDIRHSVKPGITGWAQVRYHYGGSVEEARKKHQYDLYYVKNNCLLLDLLVLVETVSVVLFSEGAK